MWVQVFVMFAVMAMAQLVLDPFAASFDDVYEVLLSEERECTEDARLVDGHDFPFQF
jgi:hypothetical protein